MSGDIIRKLLDEGALEDAIRQLKALEQTVAADDTTSVLISANLERIRQRRKVNNIGAEDFVNAQRDLVERVRSFVKNLEGDVKDINNLDNIVGATTAGPDTLRASESADMPGVDPDTVREVLLLVHGIRTQAHWFETVNRVMTAQVPCRVIPIRYGYFDIVRFLLPFGTRRWPIQKLKDELHKTKTKYPNGKISVIAHSFGTYALMHAIRDPSIELSRVILCGSIVPEDFNIERYFYATENTGVLNDCGVRDLWPVLAKCFAWGYGASGTFGFGTVAIEDRKFPFSHSEFFHQDFVIKYWVPFIKDGSIISSDAEAITSPWLSILGSAIVSIPIRLILSAAVILCLSSIVWFAVVR